jgi:hypothetical protein
MFVINFNPLITIHILNFIHDIFLYFHRSFDRENVGWRECAFGKRCSGFYKVIFLSKICLAVGIRYVFSSPVREVIFTDLLLRFSFFSKEILRQFQQR